MDLGGLRIKDLNEICKQFGIRTGGRKADIILRIQSNSKYQQSLQNGKSNNSTLNGSCSNNKRFASDDSSVNASKKHKSREMDCENAASDLFDRFQDPENKDAMTDEGILAFCEELGIDAQDPVTLVLSWIMEAKTMCVFTRSEFIRGFSKLGCKSLEELRLQLPVLRKRLLDKKTFSDIYLFSFGFAKDAAQKSLSVDLALGLWELLLPKFFPLLNDWLAFVREHHQHSISKDVWMQTMEFGLQIHKDLSNFDENGAWPVLIDDFVAHMKQRQRLVANDSSKTETQMETE